MNLVQHVRNERRINAGDVQARQWAEIVEYRGGAAIFDDLVTVGFTKPQEVTVWVDAGFSLHDTCILVDAGVDGVDEAQLWRSAGFEAGDVYELMQGLHVDVSRRSDIAADLANSGIDVIQLRGIWQTVRSLVRPAVSALLLDVYVAPLNTARLIHVNPDLIGEVVGAERRTLRSAVTVFETAAGSECTSSLFRWLLTLGES